MTAKVNLSLSEDKDFYLSWEDKGHLIEMVPATGGWAALKWSLAEDTGEVVEVLEAIEGDFMEAILGFRMLVANSI